MASHNDQRNLYFKIRALAREMRKAPTPAEAYFWERSRNRQLQGLKFNRQYVIQCPQDSTFTKYYIADFHCHEAKLIIELDGHIHLKQQEQDLIRTEFMHGWGFTVMRFTNTQVFEDWEFVERRIHEHCID